MSYTIKDSRNPNTMYIINRAIDEETKKKFMVINESENYIYGNKYINTNKEKIDMLLKSNMKQIPLKVSSFGPPYISVENTVIEFNQNQYGTVCAFFIKNKECLDMNLENISQITTYELENSNILLKGFDTYLKKYIYILIV